MKESASVTQIVQKLLAYKKTIAVIVVAVIALGYALFKNGEDANVHYQIVREPLEQVVTFSGAIVPKTRADLAFERSGRVASVNYDIGEVVAAGAIIAILESSSTQADLARERAVLASEEAALAQLIRGTREEELALERARVVQYKQSLAEANNALIAALANSYTVADTTMERLVDDMFDNPQTQPSLKHRTTKRSLELKIESDRLQLEAMLDQWQADAFSLSRNTPQESETASDYSLVSLLEVFRTVFVASVTQGLDEVSGGMSLEEHAATSRIRLTQMRNFLENLSEYVTELSVSSTLTQTTIDAWRAQVAVERANIAAALTALNTSSEKYIAAGNTLAVGTQQLTLLEAGATKEDIAAQQARADAQVARVASLQSELSKFILRSPQTGTLIARDIDPGELATAQTPVFSIDSKDAFELEARVSELDVISLEEGMRADVTLDSYGDDELFVATLVHIDPAESVVEGSPGYGVTLTFVENDPRLKSGMTANAVISMILKENVLQVPIGFIERDGRDAYLYVVEDGKATKRPVTLGTQSSSGLVEITSGISEGEYVSAIPAN